MIIPPTLQLFGKIDEILYSKGRDDKICIPPLLTLFPNNKLTNMVINLIKHTARLVVINNGEIEKIIGGYANGRNMRSEDIIFYLMLIDLINYNINEYVDVGKIHSEQFSIFSKKDDVCSSFHLIESKNAKTKSEFLSIYDIQQPDYKIQFLNQGQYPLDFNHGKNSHGLSFAFHKLYDGKINIKGKPSFIFKYEMLTQIDSLSSAKKIFKNLTTFSSWEIYIYDSSGNLLIFNTQTKNQTIKHLSNGDFLYYSTINNPRLINLDDVKDIINESFEIEHITNLKVSRNKLINLNTCYISKIGEKCDFLTQDNISKCLKNNHLVLANEANHKGNKSELYHQLQMYLSENNDSKIRFLLYSLLYQDHRNQNELNLIDKKISKLKESNINKHSFHLIKELITIDLGHKITSKNNIANLYLEKNKIIRKAIRSQFKINLTKMDIEFPSIDILYKLKILS